MKVWNLLTNRLENPVGFSLETVSLSYEVCETKAKSQKCARIQVWQDGDPEKPVYDSGERADLNRLDFELPIKLEACTRYYWRVWVQADNGEEAVSERAWFETAKETHWDGVWISPKSDPKMQATMYRDFLISKPVKKARLYGVGLGVYELYLNGEKQGNEYLAPGFHDYSSWIQYQTYELSLKQGNNRVEFMLGDGWYKGLYSLALRENHYGDRLACIADLVIWYEDGTKDTISTDTRWKARKNGVVSSSIYNGEFFDASMDLSETFDTEELSLDKNKLSPRMNPLILAHEQLKPSVIRTPAGETVLDMGQNMVGWISFQDRLPAKTKVLFQFGEILQKGNFYRDNLRSAKAEFTYRSDGKKKMVRPHFTFYGFRYVKVTGWVGKLDPEDFTGVVIHSQLEPLGTLETSDPLVNRLIENARWGQKGNFLDIPTDCPQRDERMGWTGDAQIFSGTACYHTDAYAFYKKFGRDVYFEQKKLNGSVPYVVPTAHYKGDASTGWGETATVIPWNVYLHYGKKDILRQQYDSMKAWVEYMKRQDDSHGAPRLWKGGAHFGDWLALDGPVKGGVYGATDPDLIASAYYYYSAQLLAKAAEVLGYAEDFRKYSELEKEIKEAFQREYFTPDGRLGVATMTAYVLVLFFALVPEKALERTKLGLRDQLKIHGYHLSTGFVGTPYLCRVLSNHGMNEYAYHLLLEKGYPGWLYEVLMGATTVWERWNSVMPDGSISGTEMNSLNHYSYGSIVEWMYRDMIGIRPDESEPGFKKAVIAPKPNYQMKWAKCTLRSAAGDYCVSWALKERELKLHVEVPFDAQATLILPDADFDQIRINGEIGFVQKGNNAEAELSAGSYDICYLMKAGWRKVYSIYSPVEELLENKKTAKVLKNDFFPLISQLVKDQKERRNSDESLELRASYESLPFVKETPALVDLMNTPFIAIPFEKQEELDKKLRAVE